MNMHHLTASDLCHLAMSTHSLNQVTWCCCCSMNKYTLTCDKIELTFTTWTRIKSNAKRVCPEWTTRLSIQHQFSLKHLHINYLSWDYHNSNAQLSRQILPTCKLKIKDLSFSQKIPLNSNFFESTEMRIYKNKILLCHC